MPEKRSFVLQTGGQRDTKHVFTGAAPRQAALKAVRAQSKGYSPTALRKGTLKIRELGTDTIHEYNFITKKEEAPANDLKQKERRKWLRDTFGTTVVTVTSLKKQGVKHDCDRNYINESKHGTAACPKTSAKKKKRISYVKAGNIYYSSEGKPYECPKGWKAEGQPMKKTSKRADRKKCKKQE
tara:strand:- start:947 stop:1495 length:549 start_codon:yes stop_codon:yes gene_type:complete